MPEYIVDTEGSGRVRVKLGAIPKDEAAIGTALQSEIAKGNYEPVEDSADPSSWLQKADQAYRSFVKPITDVTAAVLAPGFQNPFANPLDVGATPMAAQITGQEPRRPGPVGALLSGQPVLPAMDRSTAGSRFAAESIIPQTPLRAGVMLGTAGAGGFAANMGWKGFGAALTRVLGGTAGGTVGGVVEGQDPGVAALISALSAGSGELSSALVNRLLKLGSRRVRNLIERASADDLGHVASTEIPALGTISVAPGANGMQLVRGKSIFDGVKTPEQWRDLVHSSDKAVNGFDILGDEQQKVMDGIRSLLQAAPGSTAQAAGQGTIGVKVRAPGDPAQYVVFEEAKRQLSKMYANAYKAKQADPLTADVMGLDAKEAYHAAQQRLRQDLMHVDQRGGFKGLIVGLYDAGTEQFRVGRTLLESLKPAFRAKDPEVIRFDAAALQDHWSKFERKLSDKLGKANYDAFANAIFNKTRPGLMNDMPTGGGVGLVPGSQIGAYAQGVRTLLNTPRVVGDKLDLSPMTRTGLSAGLGQAAGGVMSPSVPPLVDALQRRGEE